MKKICAITMARNDNFFLDRWIKYYGLQLGYENLYVLLDGEDQVPPKIAEKVNLTHFKHIEDKVVVSDKRRINIVNDMAVKLFERYDLVIGTDTDEFLIVDPHCGKKLFDYLNTTNIKIPLSGLGLDVGQNLKEESSLNKENGFLSQRSYALVSARYTKPSVISKPMRWGAGFHRVKNLGYNIDKNLFLLHFGCIDYEMIEAKFSDAEKIKSGWKRHLKKRIKTITYISEKKAFAGDKFFPIARCLQTYCKSLFAWNKPTMANWKLVIKIPERFKGVI